MQKNELPLALEGVPFLLFAAFASLILALLGLIAPALFGLALCGFMLNFFRDPCRVVPTEPGSVICPADGRLIRAQEVDDHRFLHQRALQLSIFMNVFDVHVNRIPLAGTIEQVRLVPGRFYAADKDKAQLHNEHCALTIATTQGQRYALVQIAGLIARRIVCRAEPGDRVAAGERFGMIRFGSRVDLYLPVTTRLAVEVGERVRAGETVLGFLEEAAAESEQSVA